MKRPWMRYLLPQAVTFTGIFFGLLSIAWAPHHPYASGVAILVACACDLMDGRVARWTKSGSAFGLQLDSLADIINCGVAPRLSRPLLEPSRQNARSFRPLPAGCLLFRRLCGGTIGALQCGRREKPPPKQRFPE